MLVSYTAHELLKRIQELRADFDAGTKPKGSGWFAAGSGAWRPWSPYLTLL